MRSSFPNRDQLSAMSITQLRSLDIREKDEEDLVQEILNAKEKGLPPQTPIYRGDVPDIKTAEEEQKWQQILNEREVKAKGIPVESLSTATTLPTPTDSVYIIPRVETIVMPSSTVVLETKVKCDLCGKELKNDFALRMHTGKYHPKS